MRTRFVKTKGVTTVNAFNHERTVGVILRSAIGGILVAGMSFAFAANDAGKLTGKDEVPPVTTSATGEAAIQVNADKAVSGSVTTVGIVATAVHVHEGEVGKNGPAVITLTKSSGDKWVVPAGAKLSDAQYENYKAGKLYVNVHSAAHKDGEIRVQLKP
jgi:CHRD domain